MSQTVIAQFDGRAIVPDEPLEFPVGQRLRIQIDPLDESEYPLTQIGKLTTDMVVTDLAEKHATYARQH